MSELERVYAIIDEAISQMAADVETDDMDWQCAEEQTALLESIKAAIAREDYTPS